MAYNIAAACAAITANSSTTSQHACAKYVRMAIEAGGLSTAGRPVSACQYKNFLPKIGYQFIGAISGTESQISWSKANAKPGDIAVMDHDVHGHICMWNGGQWISDFKQNNMWVYGGDGTCFLFRYTGEISNDPIDFSQFGSGTTVTYKVKECPDNIEFKRLYAMYRNLTKTESPIMDDASADINLAALEGNSDFEKILDFMSREERGKPWAAPFSGKDFGYRLAGEAHTTYGFGQVYDSQGRLWESKPASEINETNLREDFKRQVAKEYTAVTAGLRLTVGQACAMCHRYHFGPAYAIKFRDWMRANGVPNADGFFNWWVNLQQRFSNWNIYKNGWTNGLRREAALWGS